MIHNTVAKHSFRTMLKDLTEAAGAPGQEQPVRAVMERYVKDWADEITNDRVGSLIARRGNQGPRIMIAGHLDEIGMMVTRIDEKGFLRFQTLGGWWSQVLPAQRVEVLTGKGKVLGVIGSKPPHMMNAEESKKGVSIDQLFVDIGVESKEEAEELGVRPGDFIVPYSPFTEMANSNRWLAKAMDNRMGCAVVAEVLHRLHQEEIDHPNTVYAVGTAMEEVGCRGAKTAAAQINPDVALVVDVGIATDSPGVDSNQVESKLGGGPNLILYDARHIPNQNLVRLAEEVAEDLGIQIQYEFVQRGATDAANIHLNDTGVPTISLGVPARYIHSHTSIIDRRDVEQLVDWLVELIKRLDHERVEELQQF